MTEKRELVFVGMSGSAACMTEVKFGTQFAKLYTYIIQEFVIRNLLDQS